MFFSFILRLMVVPCPGRDLFGCHFLPKIRSPNGNLRTSLPNLGRSRARSPLPATSRTRSRETCRCTRASSPSSRLARFRWHPPGTSLWRPREIYPWQPREISPCRPPDASLQPRVLLHFTNHSRAGYH